jgi:hypothetical protein
MTEHVDYGRVAPSSNPRMMLVECGGVALFQ